MSDKNTDELFPDITGIFEIDESSIPNVPISRTDGADTKRPRGRVLTVPEPKRKPTKEEQKREKAETKKKQREEKIRIAKTRAILILSAVVVVLIGTMVIRAVIANSKKPVISVEKAVVDSIERSYSSDAAAVKNPFGTYAVLIDNDYDIHFLEKKQTAEVTLTDGTLLNGTVDKIQEEDQEGSFFDKIANALLGERPETSVYTVYVSVNDPEGLMKDGDKVSVKIFTKKVDKAVLVPSSAVFTEDAQSYVWLYHSMKKVLSRQDVTVGISADGRTEILSGISKGDTVMTESNSEEIYNGVKVKLN